MIEQKKTWLQQNLPAHFRQTHTATLTLKYIVCYVRCTYIVHVGCCVCSSKRRLHMHSFSPIRSVSRGIVITLSRTNELHEVCVTRYASIVRTSHINAGGEMENKFTLIIQHFIRDSCDLYYGNEICNLTQSAWRCSIPIFNNCSMFTLETASLDIPIYDQKLNFIIWFHNDCYTHIRT